MGAISDDEDETLHVHSPSFAEMTPVKLLLAIVFATVDARFANAMRGAGSTIGRQAGTRSFDRCAAHARIKLKGLFCRELMFDGSPFACSPLAGSR